MNRRILVADDDPFIRELLRFTLVSEGYLVYLACDGEEALKKMAEEACQLAIVDVMMPKVNGWEVVEKLRNLYDIPILLLTAKGALEDKAKGFRIGTDDYMVKPFETEELLLRVRALLRRYKVDAEKVVTMGNVIIDARKYEVSVGNEKIELPLKEFQLLYYLGSQPNRTFTREQLIEAIWGMGFEGDSRTVDVHIKRLREKLNDKDISFSIKTIRGLGYKVEVTA